MGERVPIPFLPILAVAALLGWVFFQLHHVLIPFVLSFALAYVANPLVNHFEVRGLRRSISVLAFYLAVTLAVSLLANKAISMATAELASLKAEAPAYLEMGRQYADSLKALVVRHLPYGSVIVKNWDMKLYEPVVEQVQNVPGYLLGIFPLLSFLFLIPFISFFLLIDGPTSVDRLIQVIPARYVEQALHLLSEIDTSLGNYLRGIIIEALAVAAVSYAGLWALGVNQALAIAVLAGFGNFVPYLGPILGGVVGGLAAALQFGSAEAGLKVVLLFLVIRLSDDTLLQPIIAKHSIQLHPLVFLLSLMIGAEIFGFMGLVFAVPTACILKSLATVVWSWYSTETGLERPELAASSTWPYT
jgi:predicted PurR-regulated permease PerM